jgi:hypothetical protein
MMRRGRRRGLRVWRWGGEGEFTGVVVRVGLESGG